MADDHAERILDDLPLAVLVFAANEVVYTNSAARRLFPVDSPERALWDALADATLADAVAEAAETGDPIEVEVTHDDRELFARASVPAPGEVALVVIDRTEEHRLERVRRDFVVNASHELKTPIAGMRALAESAEMALDSDTERARHMLTRLHNEAARLSQLVRDLLDLARIEEASASARRRVDVAGIVRDQIERYQELAAERGVAVSCECDDAALVAVPEDVRLIVDNLVENAVRYNREGGKVHIATWRVSGQVIITVADTGIGIAETEQDRVFERFYRVDKARSRAAGGTGLGLSLVRNAVSRHGGQVTIDSALDEGTTVTVSLPVEGQAVDG